MSWTAVRRLSFLFGFATGACQSDPQGHDSPSPGVSTPTVVSPASTSADPSNPWAGPLSGPVLTGPLPNPPEQSFTSNPRFPSCIHPGVSEKCSQGWCRIPAGCFIFGSPPDEIGRAALQEDQAAVTLSHDFEIGRTEVTIAEWQSAALADVPNERIGRNGSGPCTDAHCPVKNVTWYQALQYANWLSAERGLDPCYRVFDCEDLGDGFCNVEVVGGSVYECTGYRLPTSAEWEYAARAGTTTAFYSGPISSFPRNDWCNWDPNLVRVAWYCANVPSMQEQPVAQLLSNSWGLHDMLGNVAEWAWDRSRGIAMPNPSTDPEGELSHEGSATSQNCLVNGTHDFCRAADRLPVSRNHPFAGFRLVRTLGVGTLPTIDDVPEELRNGWDTAE